MALGVDAAESTLKGDNTIEAFAANATGGPLADLGHQPCLLGTDGSAICFGVDSSFDRSTRAIGSCTCNGLSGTRRHNMAQVLQSMPAVALGENAGYA